MFKLNRMDRVSETDQKFTCRSVPLPDLSAEKVFPGGISVKVLFFTYDEGLCVQCMHVGSYDDEPATVEAMHRFMEERGYVLDVTDARLHHEIYLSDARKVAPEKLRTVIRHPIAHRDGVNSPK